MEGVFLPVATALLFFVSAIWSSKDGLNMTFKTIFFMVSALGGAATYIHFFQ